MENTIKPEPSIDLPSPEIPKEPKIPFEQKYRGFNDDFTIYKLSDHLIPIPELSFRKSKEFRKIGTDFDDTVRTTLRSKDPEDAGNILDAEEIYTEKVLGFICPDMLDVILDDRKVPRKSVFSACKDIYTFLLAVGHKRELQ